jgi:hypothetical protein
MVLQAKLAAVNEHDLRTAARRPVNFRAFVRETGATVTSVAVTNLSTDGCRFHSPEPFETATIVWLKIDRVGGRQARIIWRDDDHYGCEFVAPMQAKTLDEVCDEGARG